MIENLPSWVGVVFIIAALFGIIIFYLSNGRSRIILALILGLVILQSLLGYSGFYKVTDTFPPHFVLIPLPAIVLITFGLLKNQRDWIIKNRNTELSTFLHIIRTPIEISLLYLFVYKMVPELMTFEGRNFDILIGLSSPIFGWLYLSNKLSKKVLIAWNILGIGLVMFVFFNGLLSAELPFQQFAFDQPNRAVLYFPFILLPSVIVPMVVYAHITDIIKLKREMQAIK